MKTRGRYFELFFSNKLGAQEHTSVSFECRVSSDMAGPQAWMAGPQTWLAGPQAWLAGPKALRD